MTSSIAFVNQHLLEHPSLFPVLRDLDPRLPNLVYNHNEFEGGIANSWYSRTGKNTMFCNNPGLIEFNKVMPDYTQPFNRTFEQVSDQRCLDLRATHWHKPWVIMWSGGIDSTVMMTSILRNISPGDFKNIRVWCNTGSIYENPKFFNDHIRPNFELVHDYDTLSMRDDVFLMSGEPGYPLGLEKYANAARLSGFDQSGKNLHWATNRDKLVSFLNITEWPTTPGIDFPNWLYNAMEENIRSTGLPITTVNEWWWWLLVNHTWTGCLMQHGDQFCDREHHSRYFKNYIPWFHNDDYQLWTVNNMHTITTTKNKHHGKQYIHTVLKDDYYLNFKAKVVSNARQTKRQVFYIKIADRPKNRTADSPNDDRVFCILNNNECLYLDRDLDRIIELLPEHMNLDSLNYL